MAGASQTTSAPPPSPATPPPVVQAAERPTVDSLHSPVLDDQPSATDHLGFAAYVEALRNLLLHAETRTPLTLGIFGRWGTGKTTLMHMLERELRQRGVVTVWFNAWQYSKEDQLWAAFLQVLLHRMRAELRPFARVRFDWRLLRARVDWDAMPQVVLLSLWRAVVVALPLIVAWPVSQRVAGTALAAFLQAGGSLASAGLAAWLLIKPVIEAVRKSVKLDFNLLRKESDYEKHIAFLDSFREHFLDIVNSLPVKGGKRLTVFVDDLDRCSPDGTLQVLDAIKLFVDIPGCLYVLGVDVDVVQRAVSTKYRDDPTAQREYLGKLIQLQFPLPVLTRVETSRFVERIVPALPDSRCRDVFVEGLAANPREIKRAISAFSLLWSVVAKRPDLREIIKPVPLAKLVVLRYSLPDLHRLLQETPEFLSQLESHLREASGKAAADVDRGSLPPVLVPFASNETLRRMLTLYPPVEGIEDETGFATISADTLVSYFTLTRRMETVVVAPAVGAPISTSLPDFGARYRVQRLIGEGGMSRVYLALDRQRQELVAIKVISPTLQSDPLAQNRFRREIRILYRLDHRNIVRIFDDGVYDDQGQSLWYFVMEYMDGKTLKEILAERVTRSDPSLTMREIRDLLLPVLDGLSHVHRFGVVHRDLKPSTIGTKGPGVPKLMDFGIARPYADPEAAAITRTQTGFLGTPGYIAPEQATGSGLDQRSDLYSFGAILFECLTGRRPFAADQPLAELVHHLQTPPPDPRRFNRAVPAAAAEVVLKLLAKDPTQRYGSAEEAHRAMLRAVE